MDKCIIYERDFFLLVTLGNQIFKLKIQVNWEKILKEMEIIFTLNHCQSNTKYL